MIYDTYIHDTYKHIQMLEKNKKYCFNFSSNNNNKKKKTTAAFQLCLLKGDRKVKAFLYSKKLR